MHKGEQDRQIGCEGRGRRRREGSARRVRQSAGWATRGAHLVVQVLGLELDGAHVDQGVLGAALGGVLLIDVAVLGDLLLLLNVRHGGYLGSCVNEEGRGKGKEAGKR